MLTPEVFKKLDGVEARIEELDALLCRPEIASDRNAVQKYSRERADAAELVGAYRKLKDVRRRIADNEAALPDPELKALAEEELPALRAQEAAIEQQVRVLLLPPDPNDKKNTILEIRAGTGGDEAGLFAADLFRMYSRFAERQGWRVEILSMSPSTSKGIKEVIALVGGKDVYSQLRYESGVHRVQRVPQTEAQGRIHTSTATVAVLPEAADVDVHIDDKDLKIDIAASGGPGGQGVNTTNSAVQIMHLPTGIIVKCQDERSQIKNKARALKILRARLLEREQRAQEAKISAERRGQIGSGERAEKIRTYNFPQNRVTDHRVGLTLHQLDSLLDGEIAEMLMALRMHHQAEQLAR